MKDVYHDTLFVFKLIHYGWNRINRLKSLKRQEKRLMNNCGFLDGKEKAWFVERLNYATIDIKDVDEARTLNDSNLVLYDKIEVVGGLVNVSGKIDWHTDFKNHFTWTKGQKYYKYQIVGPSGGRDVKTVWDLSRCHHLLWLAAAYRQTQEEKFARRIVETIDDWISENPYGRSVNWVCPMDVSIRSVNWLFAVQMIAASNVVDVVFLKRLFTSLYQHASFVYSRLEKSYPFSENHYAADVTGLLFMGYLFSFDKNGELWLDYALQSLLFEIRTQILPSGVHYERSISYHRLVTELFMYSYLIIRKNTPNYIAIDITYRIQTMIDFIASYTKPNGYAPLFADNDNGRFLPFVKRDYREHLYLVDLAKAYDILEKPVRKDLFVDAGFAFLRNDMFSLSFTNTPTSRYSRPWKSGCIGTHTHLDALSFELNKCGEDFIVDAGAYTYTENLEVRNEFRSMQKHNTLTVDYDNPYGLNELFGISVEKGDSYTEPNPISLNLSQNSLCSAFLWKNKGVKHSRTIKMEEGAVIVTDSVITHDKHNFCFTFHLNASVEVAEQKLSSLSLMSGNTPMGFSIEANEEFLMVVEKDTVSSSYGVLLNSNTIVVQLDTEKSFTLISKFQ